MSPESEDRIARGNWNWPQEREERNASGIRIGPDGNLKKGLGHEEAETQVEVDSNSERELARETTMRNRIKTGFKEKQNRKRKQEQEPEERESLTGQNQVNSHNNAACR